MPNRVKLDLMKLLITRLSGPWRYKGEEMTYDNNCHITSVFRLWIAMWIDLPGSLSGPFMRLLNEIEAMDVATLLQGCDSVIQIIREGDQITYNDFKGRLTHLGHSFMSLIGSCKPSLQRWFEENDYDCLKAVYSFFSFPARLHLVDMPSLGSEAQEKFLALQKPLDIVLPNEEAHIISEWFPTSYLPVATMSYKPHFTSGSSKVGKSLYAKYAEMRRTPRYRVSTNLASRFFEYEQPPCQDFPVGEDDLVTRSMFVPKSHKSYRQVSLEPCVLTWISNGWAEALRTCLIKRHTSFSKRYCLNTDIRNAALARVGSANGAFATIDLQSASDSIKVEHVKAWFKGSWLYQPLFLGRAPRMQLEDRTIPLYTFMGMGSRLCFYLETIVFAAITYAAIQSIGGDPNASAFVVYGDDIVVESMYADVVIDRLSSNGFGINASKSFTTTPAHIFRESCGIECMDGVDITPVRIPRVNFSSLPSVSQVKPSHLQGLVDLANTLIMFPSARHLIIDELRAQGPLPLFGESGLKSTSSTNLDKVVWFNYEYQTYEFECSKLSTRPFRTSRGEKLKHGAYALSEWLRRSDGRERLLYPEDLIEVEMVPPRTSSWEACFLPAVGYRGELAQS